MPPDKDSQHRDRGRRRYLCWGMDFDTRALTLKEPVRDHWEPRIKRMHEENQANIRAGLIAEFGERRIENKIADFIAIDTKPMSILAYHNSFFQQARNAFVIGSYYPALVSACALGERILNHLVLDLREYFKLTPEYKNVHNKNSFDDWRLPIKALEAWNILQPLAVKEFYALMKLRHRSIHFNPSTYKNLRSDALQAILHVRKIIDEQFSSFSVRPWFIEGTKGHVFIKKAWETHPFIKTYFLPNCPFVGPYFSIGPHWKFYDHAVYEGNDLTDEEFARAFDERTSEMMVKIPK